VTILSCDHIHLKSADVEAAARWYCENFGGEITYRGQFRGSPVVYVTIKGLNFVIFGRLENETEVLPASLSARFGVDHFGFKVGDLRADVNELRTNGVRVLEEPVTIRTGIHIAYVEGPDKVRIELTQRD
jgi:catechol 2,3-dioxygenase-like lactoylglutathione lyase family enzyme